MRFVVEENKQQQQKAQELKSYSAFAICINPNFLILSTNWSSIWKLKKQQLILGDITKKVKKWRDNAFFLEFNT